MRTVSFFIGLLLAGLAFALPALGQDYPARDRLAGWFNEITNSPETKVFLARAALDAFPGTPESMAALLKADMERWAGYVRLAKIEPQ